ncbi:MAG TPA: GLPGLI family protein [Mucilaginibacter sp.]|nr:GLPGLI family protein [Mucilaginibacter sp.]
MKYTLITLACLLLLSGSLLAQNKHFTTTGTIEFEKRVNMYALIQKLMNKDNEAFFTPVLEQYKKTQSQFQSAKSILSFANNKSLYVPVVKESDNTIMDWFNNNPMVLQNNVVYTDPPASTSVVQKSVFEETFLVKDSLRKIKWKITDETRDIAGYTCRRANGIMMDSIYVVAFYTTEIPLSSGPEQFSGLPGMILGAALPHENLTWFATKVTDTGLPPNTIVPPKKGKPADSKGLLKTLQTVMKDRGDAAEIQFFIKAYLL